VPIFEGRQGLLKSAALKALADPWFTDHMPDLHSKDAQLQIRGKWLVEFAEYGQLGRADANRAKIFISIQEDRFRRPFGKATNDYPRQCVFAVTINPPIHGYLKDETGNRRFWPMACGKSWPAERQIDEKALTAVRDQLWAEADHRYGQGKAWWLHETALLVADKAAVAERLEIGPWCGRVAKAMQALVEQGVTEPTFDEVCVALGLFSLKDMSKSAQMEIGRALSHLGWFGQRRTTRDDRQTFYVFKG
jgi:putative DNA primase/helicase